MNNFKNRYLYFEKITEKEFWIVFTTTQNFLKFIYNIKRTLLLAGIFALNVLLKLTLGFIGLLLTEPTLYRTEEPNQIATEIEPTKNNWRVL